MYFFISKALSGAANPAHLLAVLVLAAALASFLGYRRIGALCLGGSALLVLIFGILPGANLLALPLETRFPDAPALPEQVSGIIALGGTERLEQSAAWGKPSLSDAAPLVALLALGRRYPEARLAFTGGYRSRIDPTLSESSVVRQFINQIGTNGEAIIYEDRSRNTVENAVMSRDLIHPQPGERWILVCQAISMPRAVAVFRKAGWNVIPYPAGHVTAGRIGAWLSLDLVGGLALAATAIHEWLGLAVYRVLGYSDDLFPQ